MNTQSTRIIQLPLKPHPIQHINLLSLQSHMRTQPFRHRPITTLQMLTPNTETHIILHRDLAVLMNPLEFSQFFYPLFKRLHIIRFTTPVETNIVEIDYLRWGQFGFGGAFAVAPAVETRVVGLARVCVSVDEFEGFDLFDSILEYLGLAFLFCRGR